jgi:hypothetical protein
MDRFEWRRNRRERQVLPALRKGVRRAHGRPGFPRLAPGCRDVVPIRIECPGPGVNVLTPPNDGITSVSDMRISSPILRELPQRSLPSAGGACRFAATGGGRRILRA